MQYKKYYYKELDSTNIKAQSLIKDGISQTSVVISEFQTAGKGQVGNYWHSQNQKNILISIIDKPDILMVDQFLISMKTSLGVIDYLKEHQINAEIKWPNDILVDNKKICGILIENNVKGNIISNSIIGIGLNLNQNIFSESLNNATSVNLIKKEEKDILLETNLLIDRVLNRLKSKSNIKSEYLSSLLYYNCFRKYRYKGEIINASIRDVLSTGELILEKQNSLNIKCVFKEIEFIIT